MQMKSVSPIPDEPSCDNKLLLHLGFGANQILEVNKITSINFLSINLAKSPIPNSIASFTIPQGVQDSFRVRIADFTDLISHHSPFPQIVFCWERV